MKVSLLDILVNYRFFVIKKMKFLFLLNGTGEAVKSHGLGPLENY